MYLKDMKTTRKEYFGKHANGHEIIIIDFKVETEHGDFNVSFSKEVSLLGDNNYPWDYVISGILDTEPEQIEKGTTDDRSAREAKKLVKNAVDEYGLERCRHCKDNTDVTHDGKGWTCQECITFQAEQDAMNPGWRDGHLQGVWETESY